MVRLSFFPAAPFGPCLGRSGGDAHLGTSAAGNRAIQLDRNLVIRHEGCWYSLALVERHLREHFNHHPRSNSGVKLLLRVWRSVLR